MWPVEIEDRANVYLKAYGHRSLIVLKVHTAIVGLFMTDNGLPPDGEMIAADDTYCLWIVHHHTVLLQQVAQGRQKTLVTKVLLVVDSEIRGEDGLQLLLSMLT